MQSQPKNHEQLVEKCVLGQKAATTSRVIHLPASGRFGAVDVAVPLRTFVPTETIASCATNFDIYTGAAILPASGTQGVAIQPDCPLYEAGYKKRADGGRECSHLFL